jgi:hypothetical protein
MSINGHGAEGMRFPLTREPLTGVPAGYSTSIANKPLPVSDLGMGVTAPAKLTHWVGYAAVGYK